MYFYVFALVLHRFTGRKVIQLNVESDSPIKRARTHTHATHTRTQVEEVAEDIKEEASDVASSVKVAVTGEPEKPKKKGWRKYILFGPRREE